MGFSLDKSKKICYNISIKVGNKMTKKLYEFKKGLMSHKIGEITSLTEEEAILLKDYVVEHFSKEQRLKNLKEA